MFSSVGGLTGPLGWHSVFLVCVRIALLPLVATLAAPRAAMQSSGVPPEQALTSGYDPDFLISAGMAATASLFVPIVPRGGVASPPPAPAAPTKADL